MPSSQEKASLKEDSLKCLLGFLESPNHKLVCHFRIPKHRLLGWNEILRGSVKTRLGQKQREKKAIGQAFDSNSSCCPTGQEQSTMATAVRNTLKISSSTKG